MLVADARKQMIRRMQKTPESLAKLICHAMHLICMVTLGKIIELYYVFSLVCIQLWGRRRICGVELGMHEDRKPLNCDVATGLGSSTAK